MPVIRREVRERVRAPWWGGAIKRRLKWRHRWGVGLEPVVESMSTPPVDVYETSESVVARVDVPGVRREDLEISVEGGELLTIRGGRSAGESDESKDIRYACCERAAGRFARAIELPVPVDAGGVRATLRDGVLEVVLPKSRTPGPYKVAVAVG